MITRFLLIILILSFIAWGLLQLSKWFLRRWLRRVFETPSSTVHNEKLIQCHTCQIFLPITQAIKINDYYYCCQEHTKG